MPGEALKVEDTVMMREHRKIDREMRGINEKTQPLTAAMSEKESIKQIKIQGPKLKEYEMIEPVNFWSKEQDLKVGF